MKIPVTYLILAIVVIAALIVGQAKFSEIEEEAQKNSKAEQIKSLESFRENSKKITSVDLALKRGISFLKKDDTQKAVAVLEQAAKLNNAYRDPNFYLGYAYLKDIQLREKEMSLTEKESEFMKAKQALLAAQKIDPLYPMTNKLLGMISQNENNDNEKRLWYARYDTVTGNVSNVKLAGFK